MCIRDRDHIDRVIQIIRGSANAQEAKANLMEEFAVSEAQAQAIVDMRLRALTGLERERLETEYKELMAKIKEYEAILADRTPVSYTHLPQLSIHTMRKCPLSCGS